MITLLCIAVAVLVVVLVYQARTITDLWNLVDDIEDK